MLYYCTMNQEQLTIDYDNCIAPWLGKTTKVVDYHLQEMLNLTALDLTKEQMIVLKILHEKDGVHQNELAFITLRNKSSLTRLISKMERKNWITRNQSESDKRINKIYLTDSGRKTFQKVTPVIKKMIDTIESNISASEKDQFIKTLQKIQANFTKT